MEEQTKTLGKGQMLADVFPEGIPTNTIVNKTVCGIGATTLEIKAQRHSIIVEPNVPVIQGKEKMHPDILAVYEGVGVPRIVQYVMETIATNRFCKILTTPESFHRVKRALYKTALILKRDFFLLFDECEKLVQDVDYRSKITLPMKTFFDCHNKAMVSATPIPPSDERFNLQCFTTIRIVPDYHYQKPITLLQTNNVFTLLADVLKRIPTDRKVCIFFNSTSGITRLIDRLDIKKDSSIYCSSDAAQRLTSKGYDANDTLRIEASGTVILPKYSFFTSRFYSAVDIPLPEKPTVILLTELYSAPHSLIDPSTEAVQILGRFRNGIHQVFHIYNYNPQITTRTDDELSAYLEGQHRVYVGIYEQWKKSIDEGELAILDQTLRSVDYSRFVTADCRKNHFMYDNAFVAEHTKWLYSDFDGTYDAYVVCGAFEVKHKYVKMNLTDKDRERLRTPRTSKTALNRIAFRIIKELKKESGKFDKEQLMELQERFGLLIDAYDVLGEDKLRATGFNERDIKTAIAEAKSIKEQRAPGVRNAVYLKFREGTWYKSRDITDGLSDIFKAYGIKTDGRGITRKIKMYFDASEQNHNDARGWYLGRALFKE